jgi:UDP-N-acetylmuramate: L-alanyl-gamma-D-glutamyl-meso-diaminopimelate ligase
MNIHFIAIGGSVMHQLALALQQAGHQITGSDDEIFEPSASRLTKAGLMPSAIGWFPEKITTQLDAVILGMHARKDNPELLKAQEMGIKVYSYPEYVYEHSKNKKRVVIAGSHGKTTTTSMIMHVLQYCKKDFDYLVGASLEGFTQTVRLSAQAPIILIEGDEYFASPLSNTPKFIHYQHHIGLITGIAWDHINVYPDYKGYLQQFENFALQTPTKQENGYLVYCEVDKETATICQKTSKNIKTQGYSTHPYTIKNGITYLITNEINQKEVPLQIFGEHNMQNLNGAKYVCSALGVSNEEFYTAMQTFKGAAKRLELVAKNGNTHIFRDFAHAPSKMKATTEAVKAQFSTQKLIVCAELHTFSSLNKDFLPQYAGSLNLADVAAVYYSPHTIAHKKLAPISEEDVKIAFQHPHLQVFTDAIALKNFIKSQDLATANLLLMSSGTFGGVNLVE